MKPSGTTEIYEFATPPAPFGYQLVEVPLWTVWCAECHGRVDFTIHAGRASYGWSGISAQVEQTACACQILYELEGVLTAACLDGVPKDVEDYGFLADDPGPPEPEEIWGPLPYSAPPGYDYSVGYYLCPPPLVQLAHNAGRRDSPEPAGRRRNDGSP